MIKLYDILKAAKLGTGSSLNYYTAIIAQGLSKDSVKELIAAPPFTFTTNDNALLDWEIISNLQGGVGDKTSNIFNLSDYYLIDSEINDVIITKDNITFTASSSFANIRYKFPLPENKIYTVSLGAASSKVRLELRYLKDGSTVGTTRTVIKGESAKITGNSNYDAFSIYISNINNIGTCTADKIMLSEGSSLLPYESYGYKIPVTCGGETKTIYLDEPLGVSDSISMRDTSILIPTIKGSNTLSVGTTVQPSSVYIKYKG